LCTSLNAPKAMKNIYVRDTSSTVSFLKIFLSLLKVLRVGMRSVTRGTNKMNLCSKGKSHVISYPLHHLKNSSDTKSEPTHSFIYNPTKFIYLITLNKRSTFHVNWESVFKYETQFFVEVLGN
jgi:hypothetical protein